MAYSRNGRVSSTVAVRSASIFRSSSVDTSEVRWLDSPSVAWWMLCACAAFTVSATVNIRTTEPLVRAGSNRTASMTPSCD